jgi:hypothetical protein
VKRRSETSRPPMSPLAAVTIANYVRHPDDIRAERVLRFWPALPTKGDVAEALRFLGRAS